MTVFAGYSQTDSTGKKDTCICVTPKEMRNAVRVDDSLHIARDIISSQEIVIRGITSLQVKADQEIKKQEELHLADRKIIDNLDAQNSALDRSNKLSLDFNAYLHKQINHEKKKSIIIAGVSVTIITTLAYLLVK